MGEMLYIDLLPNADCTQIIDQQYLAIASPFPT